MNDLALLAGRTIKLDGRLDERRFAVLSEGSDTIVVDLEAKKESLLVVSEAWFKGWKVTVDDQPAIVVSVSDFLAVQVSPGHHQVVFDYDPLSFKVGLLISGLTFLIIVSILGLASGCFATKEEEVINEN